MKGPTGVGAAVGLGTGAVVGLGVGVAVGLGVGIVVGLGVGVVVGLGVGVVVGLGVGIVVGLGVVVEAGVGVGVAVTTTMTGVAVGAAGSWLQPASAKASAPPAIIHAIAFMYPLGRGTASRGG